MHRWSSFYSASAKRCISYDRFCLTVRLAVRLTVRLSQSGIIIIIIVYYARRQHHTITI